tara:strand:+ start:200 stop:1276 length:1077 start_codon:yes stop_codon:yes gene_type:complete
MLRSREAVIRSRCREMQRRQGLEQRHAEELASRRAATIDLTQGRQRSARVASEALQYRSLSAHDLEADAAPFRELQQEERMIFTSLGGRDETPAAPREVSQDDLNAMATLELLKKPPEDADSEQRNLAVVAGIEASVDLQRSKATPETLREVERIFSNGHDYPENWPVVAVLFKGLNFFAKYFIRLHAKAEEALLAAECSEYLAKEKALRARVHAKEAAEAGEACTTDECMICMVASIPNDFRVADSGWTVLTCKHGYCTECINTWQEEGGHTCPICRAPIFSAYGANNPHPAYSEDAPVTYGRSLHANGDEDDNEPEYRVLVSTNEADEADEADLPEYRSLGAAYQDESPRFASLGA